MGFKNAGQIDSAIFWFNRTLAKDSLYGDAWGKLGEIYGQNFNNLVLSEVFLQRAIRCNPKDASSLENLGIIYALRKDFKTSIDYFTRAYAITPDNIGLNKNMGKTYQDMGNMAKAQEHIQKALALESQGKPQ